MAEFQEYDEDLERFFLTWKSPRTFPEPKTLAVVLDAKNARYDNKQIWILPLKVSESGIQGLVLIEADGRANAEIYQCVGYFTTNGFRGILESDFWKKNV